MTDKERIKELLVGMANSDWCDNAAKRKIHNEILPLIDSLPEKPELTEFERAIHRGFLCVGVKDVPITIIKETAKDALAQIQKPAEWSKDDDYNFASAFGCVAFCQERAIDKTDYERCLSWLKSLKDRVQPQPKQKWNYNDEIIIGTIIQEIERIPSEKFIDNAKDRCLDWLRYRTKSLRPQNRWKPSKEQLATLEYYMQTLLSTEHKELLFGLYNDLKQL